MLLMLLPGLLSGVLAYQAPPTGHVAVGWFGDRLFLDSSAGLGADEVVRGDFYADALTPDSPTGRSRWTREHAVLVLPNLGSGTSLQVRLLVQGWPADVLTLPESGLAVARDQSLQPIVTVLADGQPVGSFVPTGSWEEYRFNVPATLRTSADLTLETTTSATFTNTTRATDPRPKGVRLAGVWVESESSAATFSAAILPPAWGAVGALLLATLLLWAVVIRLSGSVALAFAASMLGIGLASTGLATMRIWMGATLQVVLWVLAVALVVVWQRSLLQLLAALVRGYTQGFALSYGLVAAALAWLGYQIAHFCQEVACVATTRPGLDLARQTFPDSLLVGLLGAGSVALLIVLGREGLPRISNGIVRFTGSPHAAPVLLVLLGGIWLAYEATVISAMDYVGHADYADNAVVARNLVAGRGWVVDYISQFYSLYDSLTRPQETWPLLQPVWIAPFFALFGPHEWAAKIPNLIFNAVLLLLIYSIGAHLWNRRVGITAALICLTSYLFFNLTIYTTSDLAFVVFTFAAMFLLYRTFETEEERRRGSSDDTPATSDLTTGTLITVSRWQMLREKWRFFLNRHTFLLCLSGSGMLTGLMMLQKPGGALIAIGMGVWLLAQMVELHRTPLTVHASPQSLRGRVVRRLPAPLLYVLLVGVLWVMPALLLLSPYLVRNMVLFGTPVYSTERYDAWVLGYRGDSEEAWSDIYRVYVPALTGDTVPDRSWVLRWGFDQTLDKFHTQVRAVRDYLMPAWSGLPALLGGSTEGERGGLSLLMSSNERKNLLSPLGAWLSLLGVIAALRVRQRLLSLLVVAFVPYVLFLLTYWHANEERYFLAMIPWLALLAAWMIWAGFDRLAAIGDGRWSPLALVLACVAIVAIIQPSWPRIAYKVDVEPAKWEPDLIAYEWLRTNTPPDAVIMSRNPWQLNWHAERAAVMIPNTDDEDLFFYLAGYYHAHYLIFENVQRVKGDAARMLHPLTSAGDAQVGDNVAGFTLVYASPTPDNRVLIYRFP